MNLLNETWSYLTDPSNWSGSRGLGALTWGHVRLSIIATVLAGVIAIPLGVFFGRHRRQGALVSAVVNIGRALPTFAILVLAFSVFSSRGKGLTIWPTLVALVLLAIPPIFTNTYTGITTIEPDIIESAFAMGMNRREVMRSAELPTALPLILTGLRLSAVQVVATATLSAWVGFGSLGTPIFEGFAQQNNVKVLTGAVLVAALTIVTEVAFSVLARRLAPWSQPTNRRHKPVSQV